MNAAPYEQSRYIRDFRIDPIRRSAGVGDNWPITWGEDDLQYTVYADGYGFDESPSFVTLGVSTITGGVEHFVAENLPVVEERLIGIKAGGKSGLKASGLLMVEGVLYMWVRNAIFGEGKGSILAWSEKKGVDWTWCNWQFDDVHYPVWMNAGKNYQAAQDDYCYMYSTDGQDCYNVSDGIIMARVSKAAITEMRAYQFFVGTDRDNRPSWTHNRSNAAPVFTLQARCLRPEVVYHPPSGRYLLCTITPGTTDWCDAPEHYLGIFDSPTPWGPWTTVVDLPEWGPRENRFQPRIPSKWIADDGENLQLVYSCHPLGSYQFNVHRCRYRIIDTAAG